MRFARGPILQPGAGNILWICLCSPPSHLDFFLGVGGILRGVASFFRKYILPTAQKVASSKAGKVSIAAVKSGAKQMIENALEGKSADNRNVVKKVKSEVTNAIKRTISNKLQDNPPKKLRVKKKNKQKSKKKTSKSFFD